MTTTGLDDFKVVIEELRGLPILLVGGAAALPFAADLASFSPPWPKGIVVITALAELVALILVFQFFRSSSKRTVNKVLFSSAFVLLVTSLAYLFAVSLFTYETRSTEERFVKGFVCSANAEKVFREECPYLGDDELALAEFEAERLWTKPSIAIVRVSLVGLWSASFMLLATCVGTFIIYQLQQKGRFRSSSAPQRDQGAT